MMPDVLTGKEVLQMIREAYDKKLRLVEISLTQPTDDNPKGKPVVGPELRLKHKKSGLIYTVNAVGHSQYELRTPEGEKFMVGRDELEKEYELD